MHPKSPFSELVDELNALRAEQDRKAAVSVDVRRPSRPRTILAKAAKSPSPTLAKALSDLERLAAGAKRVERRPKEDKRPSLRKAFGAAERIVQGAIGRAPGALVGEADLRLRMLADQALRAGLL